jgi:hypothetical protein
MSIAEAADERENSCFSRTLMFHPATKSRNIAWIGAFFKAGSSNNCMRPRFCPPSSATRAFFRALLLVVAISFAWSGSAAQSLTQAKPDLAIPAAELQPAAIPSIDPTQLRKFRRAQRQRRTPSPAPPGATAQA